MALITLYNLTLNFSNISYKWLKKRKKGNIRHYKSVSSALVQMKVTKKGINTAATGATSWYLLHALESVPRD